MKHGDFVQAWRAGALRVEVDRERAAAFLAARLLLPYVAIAVIGLGIGLVLWGWLWSGLAVGGAGIIVPRLIKQAAGGFLMTHIGADAALFDAALAAGALRLVSPGDQSHANCDAEPERGPRRQSP